MYIYICIYIHIHIYMYDYVREGVCYVERWGRGVGLFIFTKGFGVCIRCTWNSAMKCL